MDLNATVHWKTEWKGVKMSQTNDAVSCSDMESGKRWERKLTEKVLGNKIENKCKCVVDKIKGLIPKMKELMKQSWNNVWVI